ncbi:hypothetical protein PoB_001590600 [Plakobranchus ocellatus]|uniref:Uncharacterized protein n=1 Tax=Plakobranchus ocellatus TaxID=259542 RepID=A0AAV3Z0Q1_9GAST|nr:hypothetical protein PoB_001590600 [Plakobranchus ocellatus]
MPFRGHNPSLAGQHRRLTLGVNHDSETVSVKVVKQWRRWREEQCEGVGQESCWAHGSQASRVQSVAFIGRKTDRPVRFGKQLGQGAGFPKR